MNFTESKKVETEIGFTSTSKKIGKEKAADVRFKFDKLFNKESIVRKSKFTIVNGIPHKTVNGKLIPLTPLK